MRARFVVYGEPQGKGRPKFSKVGDHVKTRTPDQTVIYENLIKTEYRSQCNGLQFPDQAQLDMRVISNGVRFKITDRKFGGTPTNLYHGRYKMLKSGKWSKRK